MCRPPRDPRAPLLDTRLALRTIIVGTLLAAVAIALFLLERRHQLASGAPAAVALARAQTTAVTGAVLLQALYLLACRSLSRPNAELGRWSNPSVYAGIGVVLALQAAFVTLGPMHAAFGSAPLDARELLWASGAALVVLSVTWLEERLRPDRWITRSAAPRRDGSGAAGGCRRSRRRRGRGRGRSRRDRGGACTATGSSIAAATPSTSTEPRTAARTRPQPRRGK
jgi:Ca2+-transporting ATPase